MKDYEVPLLFAVFLDVLCSWLVFPDLQLRAAELGAPTWFIGLILASFYPAQLFVAPLWAKQSHKFGRKPILVATMLVSAIAMLLYGVTENIVLIWVSRIIAGAAAANVILAHSYVQDSASPYDRQATLGKLATLATAGFVAAPCIGGWLSEVGGNALVGMTASFAYMFAAIWTTLTLPADQPGDVLVAPKFSMKALERVANWTAWKRLLWIAAAGWVAIAAFETTFGLVIKKNLLMGRLEFGLLLTLASLCALIVRTYVADEVKRRYEKAASFKLAYVILGFALLLVPAAGTLGVMFLLATIIGVAWGLAVPALDRLSADIASHHDASEFDQVFRVSRSAAFFVGPIIGGLFFDLGPAVAYVVAALLVFTAAALEILFPEREEAVRETA